MATSKEIKEILVKEYGFKKKDFVNQETGKDYTFKKLEAMLKEAKAKVENVEDTKEDKNVDLSEFDVEVRRVESVKFKDDDLITVMSGVNGKLVHYSQAGNGVFTFTDFGQRQEMPYKELKNINNVLRKTLESGLIIILNKDVIKEFRLENFYENVLTPVRAEKLLDTHADEMIEILKTFSKDSQLTFLDYVKTQYNIGELDKISVIRKIEEYFNISLDDNLVK